MSTPRPMTELSNHSDGPFSPVSWHTLSHLEGIKEYQVAKEQKVAHPNPRASPSPSRILGELVLLRNCL